MPRRFGANGFSGLRTNAPAHLLEDGELSWANNLDFSVRGAIAPRAEMAELYALEGAAQGVGSFIMGGVKYIIQKHAGKVYANGLEIENFSATNADTRFFCDGDRIYAFDGVSAQVWDGSVVRSFGPPPAPDSSPVTFIDNNQYVIGDIYSTISGVTQAASCTVSFAAAHGLSVGAIVYFYDMDGMDELDGNKYLVYSVPAANQIVISDIATNTAIDSSGYVAFVSGKMRSNIFDQNGRYSYRVSYVVPDNSTGGELESNPTLLYRGSGNLGAAARAETSTMIADTDTVQLRVFIDPLLLGNYIVNPTATQTLKARVWRTRAGGAEFWLVREIDISEASSGGYYAFYDTVRDSELTTVYVDGYEDHSTPPLTASIVAVCQRRMFLADGRRVWRSMPGHYDYYNQLSYDLLPARVTALGLWQDSLAVATAGMIKIYSPVDAIGQWADTQSPVGTEYPDSMVGTDFGLVFARADGMYLFNGHTATPITDVIEPNWRGSAGSVWRAAYADGKLLVIYNGSGFKAERAGERFLWTPTSGDVGIMHLCADISGDYLIGQSALGSFKIEGAASKMMAVATTKAWGGDVYRGLRLYIDLDATGGDEQVVVAVDDGNSVTHSMTTTGRQTVRKELPPNMLGRYWTISFVGKATVYRAWLEVA